MFIINSYALAVVFCFITMLCWGSWGNTQKFAGKTWRYELFYWDYVIGMVLFTLLLGRTSRRPSPRHNTASADINARPPRVIQQKKGSTRVDAPFSV